MPATTERDVKHQYNSTLKLGAWARQQTSHLRTQKRSMTCWKAKQQCRHTCCLQAKVDNAKHSSQTCSQEIPRKKLKERCFETFQRQARAGSETENLRVKSINGVVSVHSTIVMGLDTTDGQFRFVLFRLWKTPGFCFSPILEQGENR